MRCIVYMPSRVSVALEQLLPPAPSMLVGSLVRGQWDDLWNAPRGSHADARPETEQIMTAKRHLQPLMYNGEGTATPAGRLPGRMSDGTPPDEHTADSGISPMAAQAGAIPAGVRLLATLEQLLDLDATDLDATLDCAANLVAEALCSEKSDTFLYEQASSSLVARGTSHTALGRKQRELGLNVQAVADGGIAVGVYSTGASHISGRLDEDLAELPGVRIDLGVRSQMSVLLSVDGMRRGVVQVSTRQENRYNEEDLHFLEAVARWIGSVTHRAELVERITQDAAQTASRATAEELIEVLAHDMNNYLTPLGGWLSVIRQRA
ncbi:MAG: GAF domain-containing protein, partial [Chloroflexota bacterium]|nr:GAF domain-containing protein [Chloroflexota bacterium]